MIKMIAAVCRRPGMTHAEYLAYIQHVHGALSNENPVALRRYVQNHVFDSAFGSAAEPSHQQRVGRDSITELAWDNEQDMVATFGHEHVRTRVGPDGQNFADVSVALSLVATEVEMPVPHAGRRQGAKVMQFVRAAEGLTLETFFERWTNAHHRALAQTSGAAQWLRRCVQNRQLPAFNEMLRYFNADGISAYEGVMSLWFDNLGCIGLFREYEQALLAINSDPASAFFQPAQSFFVYATEVPIYERTV